ncbi:MAG: L-threonylcarbamoyladenylate synthase [Alphaproteobacteria bacterium]|jgi:L-threonylcarbamoyladenylate synthase
MKYLQASNHQDLEEAASLLCSSQCIIVPSETVYGLAGRAFSTQAVDAIFKAKGRPSDNPLIVHVTNLEMAKTMVSVDPLSSRLIEEFWPGPLTLVMPLKPDHGVAPSVLAGHKTLAVRAPAHQTFQYLINQAGPLAAPSANISGRPSPTRIEHIMADQRSDIPAFVDAGPCPGGLESTVISCLEERIYLYRPGMITIEQLERFAPVISQNHEDSPSPGMRHRHYAPKGKLYLNRQRRGYVDFFIGFGSNQSNVDFNLSPSRNLDEAARLLFHALREADRQLATTIAVAPIPKTGLGLAINERLQRAAQANGEKP